MGLHRVGHDWSNLAAPAENWASLVAQTVKNLPAMWETWVRSSDWEDSLEKEMTTHFTILAWRIPWREEPGKLRSMGLNSRAQLSDYTHTQNWKQSINKCGHCQLWWLGGQIWNSYQWWKRRNRIWNLFRKYSPTKKPYPAGCAGWGAGSRETSLLHLILFLVSRDIISQKALTFWNN